YDITLTVWDAAGNSDEDYMRATVVDLEPPIAVIGEDLVVDQHTTLNLSGRNSTDNWIIGEWNWTLTSPDDKTTYYNNSEISHTFDEAGVHTVTLRVTDAAGLWDEVSINVTVLDTTDPLAMLGTNTAIDMGETMHLNGTSSLDNVGIVNWTWTVEGPGVNETYYGPEANHTFPDAGLYTVTLIVTDAAGNWDSDDITVAVRDTEAPVADAGDDVTVDEGRTVTLDASNSVDNVGIDWYYWDLTYDGQPVSIQHGLPDYQFTFEIPGVYNITLRVTDARGNEGTDQLVVTVLDINPPVAEAGENIVIDQHTTVTFNSPLSSDNVAIVEFNWTFGYDGEEQVLSGAGPEFTFDLPGVYNVTLVVSDAAGHTASDTLIITVVDITPPVAVAGEDVLMEVDGTLTFNGTGSTDDVAIASLTWTFEYEGGTQTLTGATPEFTFHQVGEYAVALVVADDAGNTAQDTITVSVVDLMDPVAVAGDDVTVDQGQTVDLDGSHSSDNVGIHRYTWTFTYEDAEKSIYDPIMSFEFEVPGVSTMTLTVEDMGGNVDTDTMVVTVLDVEPPVADAGEDVVVDQHTTVTFDGSGSTDNVAVVNYKWSFEYDGEQRVLNGTAPEFTFDMAGVYLVTLGILDSSINYGEDTVTVTVLDVEAPVA
ncbi:MAG: PKD domain-containing protein, partial [Candidatus Thermoplasmatota archaeon]|nr:PKD domain-containing protein [Candidatus Thermoplasmatota archaeon]